MKIISHILSSVPGSKWSRLKSANPRCRKGSARGGVDLLVLGTEEQEEQEDQECQELMEGQEQGGKRR